MLSYVKTIVLIALLGAVSFGALGSRLGVNIAGEATAFAPTVSTPTLATRAEAAAVSTASKLVRLASDTFGVPIELVASRLDHRAFYVARTDGPGWDVPRYAFGNSDNPIHFSWEKEGRDPLPMVQLYRPKKMTEKAWLDLDLDQRSSYAMGLEPSVRWYDWIRLNDIPDWFNETIVPEASPGTWETMTSSYNTTLDDQFDQLYAVSALTGNPAGHYHATFVPEARYAEKTTAFLAHMDELYSLLMFERNSGNLTHAQLGPHSKVSLQKIQNGFASGSFPSDKPYSVAFRSKMYKPVDSGRVGFEFRANIGDFQRERAFLERMVEFLESPDDAVLTIRANAPRYRAQDLVDLDRLEISTISRLGDDSALEPLNQMARASAGGPGAMKLVGRWAYPLVHWEERPHFAPLAEQIGTARDAYRRSTRQTAARWRRATTAERAESYWQLELGDAVGDFIREAGLTTSF